MKRILLSASLLVGIFFSAKSQTFTAGNIAVLVAAASANNTTASIAELNSTTANQSSPVNTFPIDGSILRFSGSATSTAYLTNSNDGTLLCFTGHNTSTTSGNINTILARAVATLNKSYTFSLATTYTGATGNQARSATTLNNSTWYIADQGGVYTNGTSTASPIGNFRGMKSFGGVVYTSQASSVATTISVNTISAATGGTITGLPGLTNNANFQDFYLISSGSNGSVFDVLYTLDASSNTVGTISKFSLVTGTWVANGTFTTTFGGFGLAAQKNETGANLFVTTGQGALVANSVLKLVDGAGYNTTINITSNTNLYTTSAGTIIKGIAFAPAAVVTPLPLHLISFNASLINNTAKLVWNTASEVNVKEYSIEKSNDGTNYSSIAKVAAKNLSSASYEYVDANVIAGVNYYRLKMIDVDGSFTYSSIVTVNNKLIVASLSVYPNPATTNNLVLSHAKAGENAIAKIIGLNGAVISTINVQKDAVQTSININNLSKGNYIISFYSNNSLQSTTFVKQ
jgi:hypothetical protein